MTIEGMRVEISIYMWRKPGLTLGKGFMEEDLFEHMLKDG